MFREKKHTHLNDFDQVNFNFCFRFWAIFDLLKIFYQFRQKIEGYQKIINYQNFNANKCCPDYITIKLINSNG